MSEVKRWSGEEALLMIEASFGTPARQVCLCLLLGGWWLVWHLCGGQISGLHWLQTLIDPCLVSSLRALLQQQKHPFPPIFKKLGARLQQGVVHLIIWRSLLPFSGWLVDKLSRCSIFFYQSSTTQKSHTHTKKKWDVALSLHWLTGGSVDYALSVVSSFSGFSSPQFTVIWLMEHNSNNEEGLNSTPTRCTLINGMNMHNAGPKNTQLSIWKCFKHQWLTFSKSPSDWCMVPTNSKLYGQRQALQFPPFKGEFTWCGKPVKSSNWSSHCLALFLSACVLLASCLTEHPRALP